MNIEPDSVRLRPMIKNKTFEMYPSDEIDIRVSHTDRDGVSLDISAATAATFTLKKSTGSVAYTKAGGDITLSGADAVVAMPAGATSALVLPEKMYRKLAVTIGGKTQTTVRGEIELLAL